jgi:hypothetical protein
MVNSLDITMRKGVEESTYICPPYSKKRLSKPLKGLKMEFSMRPIRFCKNRIQEKGWGNQFIKGVTRMIRIYEEGSGMESHIYAVVLLFIAFASLFVAQVVSVEAEPKNIIYQAMWQGDNISGELYVNGFIITGFSGSQSAGGSPLNPFLIGKNKIWAKVRRADTSKPGYLSFGISKLGRGDIASTNERGNLVSIELRDDFFRGADVMTAGKEFQSALDFSKNLSEAESFNEKEVIEYAKRIYDLFKAKNAAAILKEFKVKVSDYAKAYSSDEVAAEFESYLKKDLLLGKLDKINPNNLKTKKSGPNEKLWQVFEGDKELIRITSKDGSLNEMSMYIGKVDGKLQVVR